MLTLVDPDNNYETYETLESALVYEVHMLKDEGDGTRTKLVQWHLNAVCAVDHLLAGTRSPYRSNCHLRAREVTKWPERTWMHEDPDRQPYSYGCRDCADHARDQQAYREAMEQPDWQEARELVQGARDTVEAAHAIYETQAAVREAERLVQEAQHDGES